MVSAYPPATVSAYIIAKNEEAVIARAIRSVQWMDEVIVLDSESDDATREIAESLGATVEIRPFDDFVRQKNAAMRLCTSDWVFNLDADEEVTPALRSSMERCIRDSAANCNGWAVSRRTWYLDRWIGHCGWYPEWRMRLSRKGTAEWRGDRIHEYLAVTGITRRCKGDLLHYPYESLKDHFATIGRYAEMWAAREYENGTRMRLRDMLLRPVVRFLKMYVVKRGFLDGRAGLTASYMGGWYVFLKYALLLERNIRGG